MKEGVEESYRLRANMLRQEAKIAEQLKSIEIDRLKRLGKAIRAANQIREYCAMCDLQFYGHLSTHRKSEGHLELKKFLHPKCEDCTTEFHNRTEFDDHLLSPIHMKTSKTPPSYKSEESRKNRLQILTEADEIQGLREEKPKKEKAKDAPKEGEAATVEGEVKTEDAAEAMETDANASQAEVDVKQEADDGDEGDAQNDQPEIEPILDYNEGDDIGPEIENKIPKYSCKRQVGSSLIAKLLCFECRLCNKYFDNELTAEIHSRTYNHHRLFVKFLNEKANETKIAEKRAAAAAEETERLKRIKLETEVEVSAAEASKSELYDPTQATGEDEPKDNGPADETMAEAAPAVEAEVKPVEEVAKVEEAKVEAVIENEPVVEVETPAQTAPVALAPTVPTTPVATPAQPQNTNNQQQAQQQQPQQQQPQQQQSQQQQNNKQFNNNRGRGGRNNNNRRGAHTRYGGRY